MRILSIVIFAPFFCWGIYALDRRFRRNEEFSPLTESAALLLLVLLYAFEIWELRITMQGNRILHIFSLLGLFVAGAALYGHLAISLLSRFIVDVVSPGDDTAPDQPRFGAADMLERTGDYEGAAKEYLVMARIYPRHPAVFVRLGNAAILAERPDAAAKAFERALRFLGAPGDELPVVSRLADVYEGPLKRPDEARSALTAFLDRYPDSPEAEAVQDRLLRSESMPAAHPGAGLEALDEEPISESEVEAAFDKKVPVSMDADLGGGVVEVESMDHTPRSDAVAETCESPEDGNQDEELAELESMDQAPEPGTGAPAQDDDSMIDPERGDSFLEPM